MNPLFPDEPSKHQHDNGYLLPRPDKGHVEPERASGARVNQNRLALHHGLGGKNDGANPAVELIRRKIDALYANEPDARTEVLETTHSHPPRSKHQQFMYELTTSGKSLAEIQLAWHSYYHKLNDDEKREVWQEFYSANAHAAKPEVPAPSPANYYPYQESLAEPAVVAIHEEQPKQPFYRAERRTVARIKKDVIKKVRARESAQRKATQHLQSLAFGIGLGALVLVIFLFGLFNEMVIAPFIRPSSRVDATPIILSSDSVAPNDTPEIIIPKINVQIPIVYGGQSLAEKDVQKALESGVFHYPTTAVPGQNGNVAIFGHSRNNILNKGKYKFAFVLLKRLEAGDTFMLQKDGKQYVYRVFDKKIV